GIPGVIPSFLALAQGSDKVPGQAGNAYDLKDNTDRGDQVQQLPTAARVVGVDSTRHTQQAGDVHRVKGQVEADEEEGHMPEAERLVQHSPCGLREQVVDPAEDAEQHTADKHVVEMSDDEIGIGQVPIEGDGRQHNARQPGNQKLK